MHADPALAREEESHRATRMVGFSGHYLHSRPLTHMRTTLEETFRRLGDSRSVLTSNFMRHDRLTGTAAWKKWANVCALV